jgi:hypothetical protein
MSFAFRPSLISLILVPASAIISPAFLCSPFAATPYAAGGYDESSAHYFRCFPLTAVETGSAATPQPIGT